MCRIAVIGLGKIAQSHLNAIGNIEGVSLAAVVDINQALVNEVCLKYNVAGYTDYREIKESIDAVILNLPHFLHCEVSCYFLLKGVHVLVEKPMANTYSECLAMIEASEKSGARLAVGHIQRFFGANEIVKQLVSDKAYGPLCMTSERRNINYFSAHRPQWFLNREKSGGGILMNYGAHALDKLFYIIDTDVSEALGSSGNLANNYDIEGHANLYVRFANGVSSSMVFCGYQSFPVNETIYYFTNGAVRVYNSNCLEISENEGEFKAYDFREPMEPFEKQLTEFIKYIHNEESSIPTGKYAAKIIQIIENTYRNA